jgi:hypothetical protein
MYYVIGIVRGGSYQFLAERDGIDSAIESAINQAVLPNPFTMIIIEDESSTVVERFPLPLKTIPNVVLDWRTEGF